MEDIRPHFHITGDKGWINDPNGLVYFKGYYHAFYQYYPNDIHWGPMHWGHKISKDLIHWETVKIALFPDDETGCFSGSAVIKDNKLYLVYTGFYENQGGSTVRQKQKIAVSDDGINFQKLGVIIDANNLPNGYSPVDFRDPYVFQANDKFYCLVACKKLLGRGRILLFTSTDLFNWKFVNDIFNEDSPGEMIECPSYNNDLGLLIYSEQFQPSEGIKHRNISTTRWKSGKINLITGKFETIKSGICDYGFDFYAPTLFFNKNIMIGWLNMWDRNIPSEKYGFAGMLTVARKIQLIDNYLIQTPIFDSNITKKFEITNVYKGKLKYGMLSLTIEELKNIKILLRKNNNCYTSFELVNDEWVFNRSKSGEKIVGKEKDEDSINNIRRMEYSYQKQHQILIISDEFSLEIFVDGKSLTSTIYPEMDADNFEINLEAKHCFGELKTY